MENKYMDKHCYNCYWFNGEKGDNVQFCDDKEDHVHENGYCYRWREKWNDECGE